MTVTAEPRLSSSGSAGVLIDRDGTIIVDQAYRNDISSLRFEFGAVEGLARLAALGLPLVIVTNQSAIGRGLCSAQQVDAVNAEIAARLSRRGIAIAGCHVCPHAPGNPCPCRKPRDGLARQAAQAHGLALDRCFVIGDKDSDLALAAAIGATGILVTSGEGQGHRAAAEARNMAICANLAEAADLVADRLSPGEFSNQERLMPIC